MEQRVSISITDGVADVRLVRADKMNALDAAMFEALVAATARLSDEKGLRAVVLSGEGRAFCAGLDMGRFAAMKENGGNGIAGGESRDLTARTRARRRGRPGWDGPFGIPAPAGRTQHRRVVRLRHRGDGPASPPGQSCDPLGPAGIRRPGVARPAPRPSRRAS